MNKKEILLARHFAMLAMVYAVIAMALGVFYREFTKFSGLDPEAFTNMYQAQYPMSRQYSFHNSLASDPAS